MKKENPGSKLAARLFPKYTTKIQNIDGNDV